MAETERINDMPFWDASSNWLVLVIRADSQDAARRLAVEFIEERGELFASAVDLAYRGDDWPRELPLDGPTEIVLESMN